MRLLHRRRRKSHSGRRRERRILGAVGFGPAESEGSAVERAGLLARRLERHRLSVQVSGTILGAIGSWPKSSGFAVWTTDGYWRVQPDGTASKVSGITGSVLGATGSAPLLHGGSGVWTTDGYWLVYSDGTTKKVSGLNGGGQGIIGDSP